MRAQQILLGELDALLRPYGLTFARYEALVLLTFSRRGALPLGVIGERLMVHPTSVTNIVSRLERQQMVSAAEPFRRRGRLAEITDAGRDVVERATRDLMAAEFASAGTKPASSRRSSTCSSSCGWRPATSSPSRPGRPRPRRPDPREPCSPGARAPRSR